MDTLLFQKAAVLNGQSLCQSGLTQRNTNFERWTSNSASYYYHKVVCRFHFPLAHQWSLSLKCYVKNKLAAPANTQQEHLQNLSLKRQTQSY